MLEQLDLNDISDLLLDCVLDHIDTILNEIFISRGKVFGGYVRDVLLLNNRSNLKLKNVDIWFQSNDFSCRIYLK